MIKAIKSQFARFSPINRLSAVVIGKPIQKDAIRFTLLMAVMIAVFIAGFFHPPFLAERLSAARSNNVTKLNGSAHTLVASYYSIKNGLKATLMISNQGPNEMPVQVRLFSRDGNQFDLPAMSLNGHEQKALDLGLYVSPGTSFEEGSVQVEYQGRKLEMGGAVTIVEEAQNIIFDEELVEPVRELVSSRLEGVWWRPDGGSEIRLALSNTSSSPLTVNLTASGNGLGDLDSVHLALGPHETRVLNTEKNDGGEKLRLHGNFGGISITHSGSPGALVARGFVQEPTTGFSDVIEFSDPKKATTARLDGAGLRIGAVANQRLSQIAVVRNISSDAVTTVSGRIPYTLTDGSQGAANLKEFRLSPGEVREINLRPTILGAIRHKEVASAGLEFVYRGNPGSVIASALSVSSDHNHVFRMPMRDATIQSSSTGIYPWRMDGASSPFVYIKNVTDSPKQFTMRISFEGGSYTLGLMSVPGGQTMVYDVRSLRDSQRPDVNGNVIPVSVSEGKVHWSIQDSGIKNLIGRLEQVDTANGLSMTIACGICCPDSDYYNWISPGNVTGFIGDTQQFTHFRQLRNCFGDITTSEDHSPNWSCDNTSVATIDSFSGFATAVGAGISNIRHSFLATSYNDEGSFCSESTGTAEYNAICEVLAPRLNGPTSVTRGGSATFTITGARASQVSNWSFSDGTNPAVNGPNGTLDWAGTMVTSGTITVTVTQRGQPTPLTTNITVNDRTGFAVTAATPQKRQPPYNCASGGVLSFSGPPTGESGSTGKSCLTQAYHIGPPGTVSSGPNTNYKYVTTITNTSGSTPTDFSWALNPDVENTNSDFYIHQCGNYNAQTNPNGYISGANLLEGVIRHESGPMNSHYAFYKAAQDNPSNNIGVVGEKQIGPPSESPTQFGSRVEQVILGLIATIGNANRVEPCGSAYDATCTIFRGFGNYANPNYATCP